MKEITKQEAYRIISEPGDHTRYDYIIYPDGASLLFIPFRSTFPFPSSLDIWEAKDLLTIESCIKATQEINRFKKINPWTLLECARTTVEFLEKAKI